MRPIILPSCHLVKGEKCPPNFVTLSRCASSSTQPICSRWRALGIFGGAMATDMLDGPVARMRREVSPLGQVLDPIADKLMIDAAAITLSQTRAFPWWATSLLLARDLAILLGSLFVYRRHAQISVADPAGKATTV